MLDLSITFFVLASNETSLLYETVSKIKEKCPAENIDKIIVVLKSNKCKSYYAMLKFKQEKSWHDIQSYVQKSDNFRDALAELPPMVTGTHFVFIGADTEMNPETISDFVEEAKINPNSIIAASKWKKESVVRGYGTVSAFCSRTMNLIACLLIRKKASDLFTLYQIYPVSVYNLMNFTNPSKFVYEYSLKPLRAGMEYKEIPTTFIKATESETNFNVFSRIKYFNGFIFTALRLGMTPKRFLVKKDKIN